MFIWNESKRLKVIKNHKVDFALLTDIFDDPFGIYREDFEHSDDEIRYSVVGMTVKYEISFCGIYVFQGKSSFNYGKKS